MPKKKSEKELLEDYLKQQLDDKNIFNFHGNPDKLKGFPDRVVLAHTIYFIELKLGKENDSYYEQSPMQKKWEQQINQTQGSIYVLIKNREDIDDIVEKIYQERVRFKIKNYFSHKKTIG